MKRTYGVMHGIATCQDCGWHTESYKNAQALAAKHAKQYGHHVIGEVAYGYSYTGDGSGKEAPPNDDGE